MDGDHFNPDYYKYLLSSLTLNSRAIITELTTAAEKFSDNAEDIVVLIEERIKKCLPQHKLFSIYLLDSICKNIGNPYNLIFSSKLYKIFTDSYLVVTDTPTRQSLIELFKTWSRAKTSAGVNLFPADVISKIEKFIIKATSLQDQQSLLQSQGGSVGANGSGAATTHYLTPDMLLREGNCLLQYIIALNTELDKYPVNEKMERFQLKQDSIRNPIISQINYISESIMATGKSKAFDMKSHAFHNELLGFRKVLDEQVIVQRQFLKDTYSNANKLSQQPLATGQQENIKISFAQPDIKLFASWKLEISEDSNLEELVRTWGKVVSEKVSLVESTPVIQIKEPSPPAGEMERDAIPLPEEAGSAANALGMNFNSLNFMDSMLSSSTSEPYISPEADRSPERGRSESESESEDGESAGEADIALYNPQDVTNESLKMAKVPRFTGVMPPSNLKKRSADDSEKKSKRVRFAD
ncbi:hypothetical protein CLIB1423_08S01134 [[Candida] railenensis]|uniref:CID domain-containing protein n=1 Tax=[Candida] railenensis TaxID=45579 RepID=A0A9P0QP25_9ASCO|nr:hypothetical protein CLIB1423_08S01134 [[Candida] railenensis]